MYSVACVASCKNARLVVVVRGAGGLVGMPLPEVREIVTLLSFAELSWVFLACIFPWHKTPSAPALKPRVGMH